MVNRGFPEQARWEEDHDTFTCCVVWYHHFVDLMASTSGNFVVQILIGYGSLLAYSPIALRIIVPDHDGKLGQGALSDTYDKTAEAWKTRFGVPYSICGCLPKDRTSGSSGSSLSLISRKGKSKSKLQTASKTLDQTDFPMKLPIRPTRQIITLSRSLALASRTRLQHS
ncbi:hypothetical protein FS837_010420 [Tulasnella sp. UAMH 9824]|nr:hypothetical protein FS837_010420 [Tulasnella sp. UAMH 9824]